MTDNTERELAEIAFILRKADSTDTLLWADAEKMAAALVEVGFRRPRTITTAEELDALPDKAAILTQFEDVFVMHQFLREEPDFAPSVLPAVVLWEPNA